MQTTETTLMSLRPSRVIVLRYYVGIAFLLFLTVVLWFFNYLLPNLLTALPVSPTAITIGGTVLLVFLAFVLWIRAELKRMSTKYVITDFRVIRNDGILRKTETVVPYRQLERVQLTQGLLERILGIGSLLIDTGEDQIRIASVRDPQKVEQAIMGRIRQYQSGR